jgi:hypothetical protein
VRRLAVALAVAAPLVVAWSVLAASIHDPTAVPVPVPGKPGAVARLRPPTLGAWLAVGVVRTSVGTDQVVGQRITRRWTTARRCSLSECAYYVTRQTADVPLTARLVAGRDGWHAAFPPQREPCGEDNETGAVEYWNNDTDFTLRFSADGRSADAGERNASSTKACGYGVSTLMWHATLTTALPDSRLHDDRAVSRRPARPSV